ncbi:hypothetical protein QF032_005544 [Streptomyces achromogenes]|uniref:hypothetical protein n=1 Tax=Streptomyces achromogenes TaxID=67255 RepID=UPI00278836BB|nr:hypothetical protein [Streptomyces achromogenes]MDQ0833700.1 hypothetical protein [Streptomyces achromogenes]
MWPAETGRPVVGALREAGRRYRRPPPGSPGLEALGEREVPEFWLVNTTFG